MRRYLVTALLLVAVGATIGGMAAGCNDLGVGRKCLYANSNGDGGVSGTTISSPSLECMSRLCYLQQGMMGNPDRTYCTAKCVTDDDCRFAKFGLEGQAFFVHGKKDAAMYWLEAITHIRKRTIGDDRHGIVQE